MKTHAVAIVELDRLLVCSREACNVSKEKVLLLAGVGSSPFIYMIQYDLGSPVPDKNNRTQ